MNDAAVKGGQLGVSAHALVAKRLARRNFAMRLDILLFAATAAGQLDSQPPDVLFILADDLGYNEVNFNNASRGIRTPHLDALASGGVILDSYYVQPICSPTRSALMTGRYPALLGTQANVIFWDTPWAVPRNHTFLPELLQEAGYETALFGKWVCRATALPPAAALRGRV